MYVNFKIKNVIHHRIIRCYEIPSHMNISIFSNIPTLILIFSTGEIYFRKYFLKTITCRNSKINLFICENNIFSL